MSLTHSQTPRRFSFHKVTFPSPQLTARMFPAKLHDTLQTTSGNLPLAAAGATGVVDAEEGSRVVLTHGAVGLSLVQMITVLSYSGKYKGNNPGQLCVKYLRSCGNVAARQSNIRRPCYIPHPIGVAFKRLLFHPALRILPKRPYFHQVIAPSARKAFNCLGCRCCGLSWYSVTLLWCNQRTRLSGRSPRYSITANCMTVEDICSPLPII